MITLVIWSLLNLNEFEPRLKSAKKGFQLSNGVTLDKARALYLVRVSELLVKSMYKIDRKGGGSKNCLLWRTQSMHIIIVIEIVTVFFGRP